MERTQKASSQLRPYADELIERAQAYQSRLPGFRSEIERYYASRR